MPFSPRIARALTRLLAGEDAIERVDRMKFKDLGHGFDPFGLHPDFIGFGEAITSPLYDRYFRVLSYNHHHIPSEGPVVVACNHSGTLPVDGMMLWADIWRNTNPPRAARAVADYFVPSLPFIGTLFARGGVVGGSRGNARTLLENGEMLDFSGRVRELESRFPNGTNCKTGDKDIVSWPSDMVRRLCL